MSDSSNNRILIFNFVTITTPSLPNVQQGDAYQQKISAKNNQGDLSYKLTNGGLPQGLTLSTDGVISGTAAKSGSYTFTVEVKDDNKAIGYFTDKKDYTIVVAAKVASPVSTEKPQLQAPLNSTSDNSNTMILNSYPEYTSHGGLHILLGLGSSVEFYTNSLTAGGANQKHIVTVKSITTDSVVLRFVNELFDIALKVGETKNVDVNTDAQPDITIKLNSITNGLADISYSKYESSKSDTQPKPSTIVNNSNTSSLWIKIIVSTIFITPVIYVAIRRYKSKTTLR